MEAIIERCCGLDVHKETVVSCVLVGSPEGRARKEIRTYGTTTEQLEEMRDWLVHSGCTHVGMESTGVYWVPVYSVSKGTLRTDRWQCGTHQECARQEDGRQGCAMDCRVDPLRVDPKELRAAEVATGASRFDAVSAQAGRGTSERTQSTAASAGDLQRQTRLGSQRCVRQVRPRDAEGCHQGRGEPGADGRSGTRQASQKAGGSCPRITRQGRSAPSVHAGNATQPR
jgi:hypothetical protein